MRSLSSTLLQAQQEAPLSYPRCKVEIKNKRGSVVHLRWDRLYTGDEDNNYHDCCMTSNGILFRIKVGGGVVFEENTEASGYGMPTYGANWSCQTFTPSVGHTIDFVKLKGWRVGNPGTITVGIYATDVDGKPTGAALCSGTIDGTLYPTTPNDPIPTITLGAGYSLSASTMYAIVVSASGADAYNAFYWSYSDNDYGSGTMVLSFNSGSSWTVMSAYDFTFQEGSSVSDDISRQRVEDPDEESDYSSWTSIGEDSDAKPACCAYGTNVLIFWPDHTNHRVRYIETTDSGDTFSSPATLFSSSYDQYCLSAAMKSNGDVCLIYLENGIIYARKRVSGSWGSATAQTDNPETCTSLALAYEDDWNVLVTGKDASDNRYVWQCVFGDGNQATLNTWTALVIIMEMSSDSDYAYSGAFIDFIDVFRAFWCEVYELSETMYRNYWTHSIPDEDFIDNLWREPIPFNLQSPYGLAITHSSTHAWLSTPFGVWRASTVETTWNITDDVKEVIIWFNAKTFRSNLKIVVDNTAGTYNDFDKKGYEVIVYFGYYTAIGNEYCDQPSFWITGYKFVSPPWFPLRMIYGSGVVGTLEIEAEATWDYLYNWKARRPFEWAAGEKSVLDLLKFVYARGGFKLDVFSSSVGINDFEPEFEIKEGYSGKWAVKKLLSYVQDQLIQRGAVVYVFDPQASSASDYTYNSLYGNAHVVYRGRYGESQWEPNRVQVWGTNLMVDRFEWDEVDAINDILTRVEKPNYPSVAQASQRAMAELRKSAMLTGAGGWCQVPTNVGQELFDIITVTDYTAGVSNLQRRVIGNRIQFKKLYNSCVQVLSLGIVPTVE